MDYCFAFISLSSVKMYKFTLIAIVFYFCLISSSRADEEFAPIVNLRDGKVRGLVRTIIDGDKKTKIYFYQGFRYGMFCK